MPGPTGRTGSISAAHSDPDALPGRHLAGARSPPLHGRLALRAADLRRVRCLGDRLLCGGGLGTQLGDHRRLHGGQLALHGGVERITPVACGCAARHCRKRCRTSCASLPVLLCLTRPACSRAAAGVASPPFPSPVTSCPQSPPLSLQNSDAHPRAPRSLPWRAGYAILKG
jgi:hypothetical protein